MRVYLAQQCRWVLAILLVVMIEQALCSATSMSPFPSKDFLQMLQAKHGQINGVVCSLYGFSHSKRSKPVRDIIIDKVQDLHSTSEKPIYIVDNQASDDVIASNLFVACLNKREGGAGVDHLLTKMQKLVDISRRNRFNVHFVLVSEDGLFCETEVKSFLEYNSDCDIKIDYVTLETSIEALDAKLQSILSSKSIVPLKKVSINENKLLPLTESINIDELNTMYNEVASVFKFEMSQLGEYVNINETVSEVEEVMQGFSDMITSQLESQPPFAKLLLDRVQVLIDEELNRLFGQVIAAHKEGVVELYTKRLAKVPPTAYRSNAYALLGQIIKRHEEFKIAARKEFERIRIIKPMTENLGSKLNWRVLGVPSYSNGGDLRAILLQQLKEREEYMIIQGLLNPFVRQMPFPPTHININYFVDPRGWNAMREFNSLYDEHRDGYTLNRADPLEFKGVASSPFDPNLRPTPTEKLDPWWVVVKDFFSTDE